ncbi:UDP-N-acetylglucosamine pyrophosphorylase [Massospora cicadina]|nr:UDP-N-acetylglucosamine pyrophosphorylase [Massospora cicadina]
MLDYTAVKTKFEEAGQSHVFSFFDALSSTQQQELLSQLEKIDPTEIHIKDSIEPLPAHAFDSAISSPEKIPEWEKVGMDLIARNKVAVLLLAGGQGTRGSSDPKGCYNIGLPSENLFSNCRLSVFAAWRLLLRKIILEDKAKVAVSPDGDGGIYPALRKEGVIENMAKRGIEYIHSYCVDNCLVRVADPVFIGYSVNEGAECGAKVVPKSRRLKPNIIVQKR